MPCIVNRLLTWLATGAAAFALFVPAFVRGQAAEGGTITGHVRGPGGVAVPGATVVLVQPLSGERKMTWTDEAGDYRFGGVLPGTYRLEVSLVGFRGDVREPVPISPGKALKVNVALVIASGDENGSNASSAARARPPGAGGARSLESLPAEVRARLANLGNDASALGGGLGGSEVNVRFAEGAGTQSEAPAAEGETSFADAGASAANSFLIAGTGARAPTPGEEEGLIRQRLEEFRRYRESQGAPGFGGEGGFGGGFGGGGLEGAAVFFLGGGGPGGFGGRGGGGGGRGQRRGPVNRIRGTIFERYSNSAFNAHPYPLNSPPLPLLASYSEQAGIVFGGPLNIPRIYHGQDKTSFFVNYGYGIDRRPFDGFATVPTASERAGDFSAAVIPSGPFAGQVPTIFDPGVRGSISIGQRAPFPGNVIPAGRIDPGALALLKFMPFPNLPGSVQNFHLQETLPSISHRAMARIGHRVSAKDNLNVFYFYNLSHSKSVATFPALTRDTSVRGQNVNFGETHTFSPRVVNNFMLNYNRQRTSVLNPFAFKENISGELGIQGVSADPGDWGLPIAQFTNFAGLNDAIPSLVRNQTYRMFDFLIVNRGKHNFRMGGELRRVHLNTLTDPDARGTFNFTGFLTSQFTSQGFPLAGTGFDFADFLLGLPQVTSVRFGTSSNYFRTWYYSGFLQDDWRATPHLTFNLGLRYEYFRPFAEKFGHLSDLDIGQNYSTVGVVTGQAPGGLPTSLIRGDANNLAPRIGVAFRPWSRRKLVFRAGYGVFYDTSIYQRLVPNLANQPPFAQASTLSTSARQVLTLEQGFPQISPTVASNTYAVDHNFRTPYGQTWNFGLEDEIFRDSIFSLTYTGTKGTKLDLLLGPNRAISGSPLTTQDRLAIRNALQFTYETSGASSIYHGLQAGLRRQFHHGFSVNATYTFSKSIDDAASVGGAGRTVAQNFQDLRAERGLSMFDVRHRVTLGHLYEFPFGERHRYLNRGGPLAAVFGDWQLSGNATLQTGSPFTARVLGNASNNSGTGAYFSERADATGASVSLPGSDRTTLRYFNTAAFTLPAPGEFGNAGRNTIPGPGTVNFNTALGRFVTLSRERDMRADFRVEASNVFNTPNFGALAAVVNATDFGRVTSVKAMRSLVFSMRLRF